MGECIFHAPIDRKGVRKGAVVVVIVAVVARILMKSKIYDTFAD